MSLNKKDLCLTHSSTAKQEEEQEERGSCQTVIYELFNIRGEKIDMLFSAQCSSGINTHECEIQNLKSGVFFLKLQTQKTEEIQKIIHF